MNLTNQQWALIEPLIIHHDPLPSGDSPVRGRPPIDPRPILDGILWKISHAEPWAAIPKRYPSPPTCFRRYRLWRASGVLNLIFHVLAQDLFDRGGFDLSQALADRQVIVARQNGRYCLLASAHLHDTWQLSTALVILQIALTRMDSICLS